MVYLSKLYTKFGDQGETMLASGDTVAKSCARVDAYGDVDELNSVLGLVRLEITRAHTTASSRALLESIDETLAGIQQELFDLGAELAEPGAVDGAARLKVEDEDVARLERAIDLLNAPLEPLRSFVLPGGGPVGIAAHLARTVCRRAERKVVALQRQPAKVRGQALRYLNRLSDYLFVVARATAHQLGHAEVLWDPARRQTPPTSP